MKVAYLGPENTFTHRLAKERFPEYELIPVQPIMKVVRSVEAQIADFGVVPIENFYNGEVRQTLDSLTECAKTKIIEEKSITIVHCIGALPPHITIEQVLSKDQALEQCSKYLSETYPNATTIATSSTAEAAQIVAKGRNNVAAIASEAALKSAGLEIIARDICPNNRTRFVILGTKYAEPTGDDKTFLAIHPPIRDRSGVLDNTLSIFASLGINLEYIQSRPDGKKGYIFYIELDGHAKDETVETAISAIRLSLDPKKEHPNTIKILGSYPNTRWKDEN